MGQITADQSQQVMATLMANCRWSEIDFEKLSLQDSIIKNSKKAGLRFTEWLKTQQFDDKDQIIRTGAGINRSHSPPQVLEATGRKEFINFKVVVNMPKGEDEKEEVEIVFFKLDCYINDNDLEKEYAKRRLAPVDPYSLAKVNKDDPAFADDFPNCTHWKDTDGRWCYLTFFHWSGERGLNVDRRDVVWGGDWWFGGFRK